jgi:hypothetical protein
MLVSRAVVVVVKLGGRMSDRVYDLRYYPECSSACGRVVAGLVRVSVEAVVVVGIGTAPDSESWLDGCYPVAARMFGREKR